MWVWDRADYDSSFDIVSLYPSCIIKQDVSGLNLTISYDVAVLELNANKASTVLYNWREYVSLRIHRYNKRIRISANIFLVLTKLSANFA